MFTQFFLLSDIDKEPEENKKFFKQLHEIRNNSPNYLNRRVKFEFSLERFKSKFLEHVGNMSLCVVVFKKIDGCDVPLAYSLAKMNAKDNSIITLEQYAKNDDKFAHLLLWDAMLEEFDNPLPSIRLSLYLQDLNFIELIKFF